MPHDSVIAGFWIVSMYLWECCPCGLHSVISSPGWGEPRFPHCAFVASWLTDYCMAFLWFCCSQSLRWYNVIISSCTFQMPVNWSADHRPCWFFVLFFWCLCVWCVVFFGFCCLPPCFARWQLNGLCIDPTQSSFVGTLLSWLMLPLP